MKNSGVLTFGIVLVLLVATSQAINATYGYIGYYDKLLHVENVLEEWRFFRKVTRDVVFPPPGYRNPYLITAVRAIDQNRDGNGGYPTLVKGGPGFRNVTLRLKSARNYGLNYTVEIFCRWP